MPDGAPLGASSGINLCLGAVRNAGLEERHGEAIQGFESHEPSPVGVPPSCMQ